jgi:hypothetical protein
MQFYDLCAVDVSRDFHLSPALTKGRGGVNFVWSCPNLSIQLNDVVRDGWLSAPFGVNSSVEDPERRQLTLVTASPTIVGKLQELEQNLIAQVEANRVAWFGSRRKDLKFCPLVKPHGDQGTHFKINTKVRVGKTKTTEIWVGAQDGVCMAYERGSVQSINRDSDLAVRVTVWGVWIRGGDYGLGVSCQEVMVVNPTRSSMPNMSLPYTMVEGGVDAVNGLIEDSLKCEELVVEN